MKKLFLGCMLLVASATQTGYSQSVGIGTDYPDNEAILDVSSTTHGVFIPRLTTGNRNTNLGGLNATDEGLLIYNTTDNLFNYWDGTQWIEFPGKDHDWYENSTPNGPPDNISDDIYTNGRVGIGQLPAQSLHIDNTGGGVQSILVEDLASTGDAYNPSNAVLPQANRGAVIVDVTTGVFYAEDANRAFWRLDGNAGVVNAGYSGSCPNLITTSMNGSGYEYLGTNDNTDFIIATNDRERLRVLRDGQLVAYGKGIVVPASSPTGCVPAYPVIDAASFYGTNNTYPLNAYSEDVPAVYGSALGVGSPAGVAGAINGTGYGVWGYVDGAPTFNSIGVFGEEVTLTGWAVYGDGDINCTNLYYNLSDISLKERIREFEGGLDAVMALQPKTYRVKEEYRAYGLSGEEKIGFVAQDVEEVLPELVKRGSIPGPHLPKGEGSGRMKDINDVLSVSYVGLVPVLTSAIQEQQEVIEELEQNQEVMMKRIAALEQLLMTPPPGQE